MNFTIPQFIEIESKVVGPLTFRQFIFVAVGTTLSFAIYFSLGKASMPLALALIAIIEGGSCALAFVKVDGIEITTVIQHYFAYSTAARIFLWQSFEIPNQKITAQEKITLQKAPSGVNIVSTPQKDNLQKIRDYMETI
jgi:hypothetical protein